MHALIVARCHRHYIRMFVPRHGGHSMYNKGVPIVVANTVRCQNIQLFKHQT